MRSNRQFSLAQVVSIEAWYARFTEDERKSEFFLHIKFQDGTFGADPEMPVRFKIRLRRANVVVMPEEPIQVPRSSVRRDRISVESRRTEKTTKAAQGKLEASVDGSVSSTGLKATAQGKAEGALEATSQSEIESTFVTHSGMSIEHDIDDEGYNRWSFAPVLGDHLLGQAFHGTEAMMLLEHKNELAKISPTVKVRVMCLREDIDILELEAKNSQKSFWQRGMGRETKLKLAEQFIREELSKNGLEFEGDLDEFSKLVVAEAFAAEE